MLKAESDEKEPHFFVSIDLQGGWDVTLAFDPLTHDQFNTNNDKIFLEYTPEQIFRQGSLSLGIAAQAFKSFLSDLCVINGIDGRRDGGHITNRHMMLSGFAHSNPAAFPFEIYHRSAFQGSHGVLLPGTSEFQQGARSHQVLGQNQMAMISDQIADFSEDLIGFDWLTQDFPKVLQDLEKAARLHDLIFESPISGDDVGSALACLFASGSCFQAAISINDQGNLDTHQDHESLHLAALTGALSEAAGIIAATKKVLYRESGKSIYDLTTFYITSEFARTPQLNGSKGKDHNAHTNSVALIGNRIQGGQTVGASYVRPFEHRLTEHAGCAIDRKTGKSYDFRDVGMEKSSIEEVRAFLATYEIDPIFPENIAITLAELFGIKDTMYEEVYRQMGGRRPFVLPGVLKK